jgi:hypothetical protein
MKKMEKYKKLTIDSFEKAFNSPNISQLEFPEVKQIGNNIYEYRCGNHVIQGNKQGMEDIDKELLKYIKGL